MITLSSLKSHWKDILRFCSFHGLSISELIQGVNFSENKAWVIRLQGLPLPLSHPNICRNTYPGTHILLLRKQSYFRSWPMEHQMTLCIMFFHNQASTVKLKEYSWTLGSGRVMSGPSVETSSWGILFENNSLLAELFLRDRLNKASRGCSVVFC